jgi:ABC-type branched-subunit amino acid transport system substrate-binding protein
MRRRVKVVAVVAALALVVTVGALARTAADPGVSSKSILIGGTFPLSGPASLYGTIPQAEKAFFDWYNATHPKGIFGRKINFKYLDDGYNPAQTVPLTRQLVEQDKVFAIFNSLGTAPNLATRPYLNQRKVPQVLLATGDSYWGYQSKQYPWTIGYNPDYIGEGVIYGKFIQSKVPQAKIAVLYQNDAYGQNYLQGLKAGLGNAKEKIVDAEPYDANAVSVTQQMVKLKSSGANVFMDFATPSQSIAALVTAAKLNWHPTIFVNNVSASPAFMAIAAKTAGAAAVDGAISTAYLKTATNPAYAKDAGVKLYKSIMAKYYAKGNVLDDNNIYGMSAAWTMVYALQHAGKNPTRASLLRALTHMSTKANPFLFPGIVMKTSSTDHFLIDQLNLIRWQGTYWHPFGHLFNKAR